MELSVLNIKGEETEKTVVLNEKIFAVKPNEHVVYLDVKNHLARKRQGTSKAKQRSEISGSTRKIKRQKGTGTARAGSIKSPIFRGGGVVFGPHPRTYGFKLNKKEKKIAKQSVLSARAKEGAIKIIEDFNFENPKTKTFIDLLNNLKIQNIKSLLLLGTLNKNIFLSARNLKKTNVLTVESINTYDLINAESIIICESSLNYINQQLS